MVLNSTMSTNHTVQDVSDAAALEYVDDLLTWWQRRGRPDRRALARRAQQIVSKLRREHSTSSAEDAA